MSSAATTGDLGPPSLGRALVACGTERVLTGITEDSQRLQAGARFEELSNLPGWLPPAYARHYTPHVLADFADCVKRTGRMLAGREQPKLSSTAEELAAHAILGEALRSTSDRKPAELAERGIRDRGEALEALELIAERAFQDGEMLILFDPELRTIMTGPLFDELQVADLAVEAWFTPRTR